MDELRHHGIKGMKWGVRRYQNKDGSYTPAGKKRRASDENRLSKEDKEFIVNAGFSAAAGVLAGSLGAKAVFWHHG